MLNANEVLELLAQYDIKAETQEVAKNNNVILHGIVVGDGNIRPTLYLENYEDLQSILKDAIRYKNNLPAFGDNLDSFTNWDYVKDKLRIKLSQNPEAHLVTYPAFCDLKQTVYIKLTDNAMINVKQDLFQSFGIAIDHFFKLALENTARNEGELLMDLNDLVPDLADIDVMHVLTNKSKLYGASALLYSKVLPDRFYMLPSSVHETILLYPINYFQDVYFSDLSVMVREVNSSSLDPIDVLSNHAYYYEDGKWTSLE